MPRSGDIFHTNTLEVLDGRFAGRDPAFRKGNLLISVLKLDTLAVLDPEPPDGRLGADGRRGGASTSRPFSTTGTCCCSTTWGGPRPLARP